MMQTEVAFPSSMWTLNQTTVSGQPFFYNRGFWCCKAIIAFNNNDCQDLVFCMWHANSSVQCSMCGDRINVNNMGPSLESIFKSTPRNVSMASLGPKREKQHIVLCQGVQSHAEMQLLICKGIWMSHALISKCNWDAWATCFEMGTPKKAFVTCRLSESHQWTHAICNFR